MQLTAEAFCWIISGHFSENVRDDDRIPFSTPITPTAVDGGVPAFHVWVDHVFRYAPLSMRH